MALVDILMPQLGTSVVEGTIVEWHAQVGDAVGAEATICEVSTDKIDTDCPAPVAGTLAEVLVAVGETVDVGTVLGRIATDGEVGAEDGAGTGAGMSGAEGAGKSAPPPDGPASPLATAGVATVPDGPASGSEAAGLASPAAPSSVAQSSATAPAPSGAAAAPDGSAPTPTAAPLASGEVRSSPVSRRIAAEHGIDLAAVPGTGRGGRVTKKDVLAFVASGAAAAPEEPPLHSDSPYRPDPAPPAAAPASAVAPAPAPAPASAATPAAGAAPAPAPASAGAPVDLADLGGVAAPLSRMRQRIGAAMHSSQQATATCHTAIECDMTRVEARRAELGLTALPLVARAVIETLAEFPDLNATLDGTTMTRFERVHLGIAVSLGDDGLIVPVVHDAQNLSPQGLGQRIREVARRARDKRLQPDEVQGATFTITNPGAYGALWATPVIDVPQVGILDLEAIVRRPVVVDDGAGNESIAIRSMVNLILGWDHRAMDGVYAARFLTALRRKLESL